jgi:hypothetical protein
MFRPVGPGMAARKLFVPVRNACRNQRFVEPPVAFQQNILPATVEADGRQLFPGAQHAPANFRGYFAASRNAPKPPIDSPAMKRGEAAEEADEARRATSGTSSTIQRSKSWVRCGR